MSCDQAVYLYRVDGYGTKERHRDTNMCFDTAIRRAKGWEREVDGVHSKRIWIEDQSTGALQYEWDDERGQTWPLNHT